jgi:hypothetical protein
MVDPHDWNATRRVRKERQIRLVPATVALLVGAVMLLPAATAPTALAQVAPSASVEPSASVAPSASVEPLGSPLPDAIVELAVGTELEPARNWAIAVTGGSPSVDVVTVRDPTDEYASFTVAVFGQSATVEMTLVLPAGSQLAGATCEDFDEQVNHDTLVPPRQIILEVVQGGHYLCVYGSDAPGEPEPTEPPAPTAPPTDSLGGAQAGSSSDGWPLVLTVMAAAIAASLLIAVRTRLRP